VSTDPRHGRLEARPGIVAAAGPSGLRLLSLHGPRDAFLYVPESARPPMPLVLVLHGSGGEARHGIDLLSAAADECGAVLLAPASTRYTWDVILGGFGADVALVDAALTRAFLDYPIGTVAIAGFSDGASYALSLGLTNGDLFSEVLAFSPGMLNVPRRRGRPRIYVSHGRDDRVLPVATCGRRIARMLRDDGYDVAYHEFDGGHVVPADAARSAMQRVVERHRVADVGNAARPDAAAPDAPTVEPPSSGVRADDASRHDD
jgi:predicted esterase